MVTRKLRRRRDRGAAAVEFALVVPLLVMILFGIVEFGNYFFIQSTVAGAARVGVRSYVVNWTKTGADATAIDLAKQAVPNGTAVVSAVFTPPCTTTVGSQTRLVLTYRYSSLTGLLDGLLGSNITVTGVGSMACGG
jgi:Flp pilus assembly protein TadG